VENPAYCRSVHGRVVYIVGRTPRTNGGSPGRLGAAESSGTSAAVYSGET
jgi:hypothetical protein